MRDYKLVYYPDESLLKPCKSVEDFSVLPEILDNMRRNMEEHNGMGIASNQLGYNLKIFIMREINSKEIVEFINPTITERAELAVIGQEGCLSAPGVYVSIPRHEQITVEAFKRTGEAFKVVLVGMESVCAQHEIDHLDGIFYIDKLNRQQRRAAMRQFKA